MSETVHYRGVLKKVERKEGETLEEQCKRLVDYKELPSFHESYEEFLKDVNDRQITIQDGNVYRVEKEDVDPDEDIFKSKVNCDGDLEFEVKYYSGGCGFDDAIEEALENKE